MKILNYFIIIFICINPSFKADLNQTLINELQQGGKLIFISHAYAPSSGEIVISDKSLKVIDTLEMNVKLNNYVI